MFEITIAYQLAFRMLAKPALAVAQQFFDFVVADPIVFVVVQHGNQHVEMRQQLLAAGWCP